MAIAWRRCWKPARLCPAQAATELAWRDGWFHTGDVVWRRPDGLLHFVRKKNILRRSGENIAAAEVEALLLTHPEVHQVAVMPVKDELREEEVLACVVLRNAKHASIGAKPPISRLGLTEDNLLRLHS